VITYPPHISHTDKALGWWQTPPKASPYVGCHAVGWHTQHVASAERRFVTFGKYMKGGWRLRCHNAAKLEADISDGAAESVSAPYCYCVYNKHSESSCGKV
jgi:hypothetical protein